MINTIDKTTKKYLLTIIFIYSGIVWGSFISFFDFVFKIKELSPYINEARIGVAPIYVMGLIFIYILWEHWNKICIIPQGKIGILFAPYNSKGKYDSQVIGLYEILKNRFDEKYPNIICKKIPCRYKVKNYDEASKYIIHYNYMLVIYGRLKHDTDKGFDTISYIVSTYKQRLTKKAQDICTKIVKTQGFYSEDKKFEDRDILVNNLQDTALFLTAIGLLTSRQYEKCISSCLKLRNIERFYKKNKSEVNFLLENAYICKFYKIYENHIKNNITGKVDQKYIDESYCLLGEFIKLSKNNTAYHTSKAILCFHEGKVEKSYESIKKSLNAKNNNAINKNSSLLSKAFLELWNRKYVNCIVLYKRIAKDKHNVSIYAIYDALDFLDSLIKNKPERVDLLFAYAFINHHFFDELSAQTAYEKFIELSKDQKEYATLVEHSKRKLKTIN